MHERFVKGSPLPQSLGHCGDLYREVQDMRLAMQKEVDAVKERETEIEDHLINNISKSSDRGVVGLRYVTKVVNKPFYKVSDWPLFYAFVKDTGRFDFLEKRLAKKATKDYVEQEKELLPGTEEGFAPELSVTKI